MARAGIGLDNVDVDAATRRGVMVVNAPQSNIISAAEHTIALLLAQARNIPQAHASLTAGAWERSRWEGVELAGKTIGLVGLGRVGALVAQRAAGFGMRVIAFDPYVSAERAKEIGVDAMPSLEALLVQADFVSIHLPRTSETEGLIGELRPSPAAGSTPSPPTPTSWPCGPRTGTPGSRSPSPSWPNGSPARPPACAPSGSSPATGSC